MSSSSIHEARASRRWRQMLLIGLAASWPLWGWATQPATEGQTTGAPTLVLPDGGRYFGPLQAGLLHGRGRIEWDSDNHHEGEFVQGRMQGHGKRVGPTYVYEGEFVNGAMQGRGKFTRGDGNETYEGEFMRDVLEGQGTLTFNGGHVYQGRFKQDKPAGAGRMTYPSGIAVEGSFAGYEPVGPVTVTSPEGTRYEGEWQNQMPHGQGALTLQDRSVVRGTFRYGEIEGPGTIAYPDGARYSGSVLSLRAHGRGELRYANGDVYIGRFAQGQPDGKGRLTTAAGPGGAKKTPAQEGYWRMGKYLGPQGDGTVDPTPGLAASNNETVLYNQPVLLQQQIAALRAERSGPVQMHALFVAGDGSQEVFRREVAFVDALFARRFDTRGRSISLVNSRSSVTQLPLATAHSIERALQALAQNMDRERDLLFVFLSSHGSRTHELALGMDGMALPALPAARLGALLKASGIRNQVVVVSACYAGGFIPSLQGERTWVITAARADRTSFGCADENDFTYFGRALFKESLPNAPSLSAAVARAIHQVEAWEARDAKQADASAQTPEATAAAHSEPQSVVAPAFRAEVDDWFASRGTTSAR